MICDSCKIDRLVTDYINNQKFCYHCEYRNKLRKMREKQEEKPIPCRTCGKDVIQQKDLKKRQRTVFCSENCALAGHKEIIKNYWCRKVPNTYPMVK